MCKSCGNSLYLDVCPLHPGVVLVRGIKKPKPEESSELADALDSQLRVHDDNETPSTLLESGTEEEIFSIVYDATGEEISWT